MNLPRIHSREAAVKAAELDLSKAILDVVEKRGLTDAEALRCVNAAFGDWIGSIAKHAIRAERHPDDPEKPGGWA